MLNDPVYVAYCERENIMNKYIYIEGRITGFISRDFRYKR